MSDQPTKTDQGDRGVLFNHPSYGNVVVNRVSGTTDLFMVDYPQQHFVSIEVSTSSLRRDLSHDWTYGGDTIVRFFLSEVQWARLVASVGQGSGVPVTLSRYRDPSTGKVVHTRMHQRQEARGETLKNEAVETARDAAKSLDAAIGIARAMTDGGGLKRGDLKALSEALAKAKQELESNIGFVIESAQNTIQKSVESAKGEIDAYQTHATARLGRLALAERAEEQRLIETRRKST